MQPTSTSQAVAARKSSNLAFALRSLEPRRRHAMEVFYDFCRVVDDIVDDGDDADSVRAQKLDEWRSVIRGVCGGATDGHFPDATESLASQLARVIQEFELPSDDLLAIVDGCAMDIGSRRYETVDDLRQYCYGVASAVGLVSIRIFGCTHPDTRAYAETLGYALQFTNILRDVVEDRAEMGRVYLPQAELRAFGLTEADLDAPADNPNCQRLFRLCYYRCKHFFNKARRLMPESERHNLTAAFVMAAFYEAILEKIRESGFRLGDARIGLSKGRKISLLLKTLRQAKRPLPPKAKPGRVLVWGGGISGMCAALELGRQGFTPVLLESRSRLGGRAHSLTEPKSGLVLDNGQHILMGCYHAFLRFIDTLGSRDRLASASELRVPYSKADGGFSVLAAGALPAPLHLLSGLMRFDALDGADKLAIIRLGSALRLSGAPKPDLTARAWLDQHRQTPGAIRALWEPFCVAALNESLDSASATLLWETLKRSLFGNREDSAIFVTKGGFSSLFEPELERFLAAIGGRVELKKGIRDLITEDGGQTVSSVSTNEGKESGDWHVSALPWTALRGLLPDIPLKGHLAQMASASIIGVHLLVDRKLFDEPCGFTGFLDSPVHWVFDRTHTLPEAHFGKYLYSVVISAADDWLDRTTSDIQQCVLAELKRFLPAAATATIEHASVFKWRDATFAATPQTEPLRPGPLDAPWNNVVLAGDWVDTGLPATLESAAQSGFDAVSAIDARALLQ